MSNVIDYEYTNGGDALCPFTNDTCKMECMMIRPTVFDEPRCSFRVIADELVNINSKMKKDK